MSEMFYKLNLYVEPYNVFQALAKAVEMLIS